MYSGLDGFTGGLQRTNEGEESLGGSRLCIIRIIFTTMRYQCKKTNDEMDIQAFLNQVDDNSPFSGKVSEEDMAASFQEVVIVPTDAQRRSDHAAMRAIIEIK